MKKTFQKTLIAAAAGVALMSAAGTASANSLLFPYWTTATGAQSVLSISANSSAAGATATSATREVLHYVYNYGTACVHHDNNGAMSANDLMQHSIAHPTTANGFGKAVGSDGSTPYYFPNSNSFGFLVVSNKTNATGKISGEMAIVDPSTGLVFSYAGISNELDTTIATNEGNFSGITDQKFNLSFYGSAVTSTTWYGVVAGDMSTKIGLGQDWDGASVISNNGNVYNNDEVAYSGTSAKRVTCAGTFVPSDLMSSATLTAIGGNGGLVHATATPATTLAGTTTPISTSTGLVLMKMQAVQAAVGAPFAGKQFMHREVAPAW